MCHSKDELQLLIQAMSKSERRHFTISHKGTKKAMLFNALVANKEFRDPQIHNLRSELYQQVLNAMKKGGGNQSIVARLTDQLEEVRILFSRRLFLPAYRQLQQIKKAANYFHQVVLSCRFPAGTT